MLQPEKVVVQLGPCPTNTWGRALLAIVRIFIIPPGSNTLDLALPYCPPLRCAWDSTSRIASPDGGNAHDRVSDLQDDSIPEDEPTRELALRRLLSDEAEAVLRTNIEECLERLRQRFPECFNKPEDPKE